MPDTELIELFKEYRSFMLNTLDHEEKHLTHLAWKANRPENQRKYYEKLLQLKTTRAILTNLFSDDDESSSQAS